MNVWSFLRCGSGDHHSEYLFYNYPDMAEGEMTKLRASIVCEPTLALCTHEISFGSYLFLGKGEERTGGRNRDSIVSDAMESVIGAIYLDGGFASAKGVYSINLIS